MSSGKDEEKISFNNRPANFTCIFTDMRDLPVKNCAIDVKGQKSDSVSPTDIWLIKLKEGTAVREGDKMVTIESVFLKYYINPESWIYYRKKHNLDKIINPGVLDSYLEKIYALEYENKVYNEVVSEIIENSSSPHFIRSFSRKNECSYHDLVSILIDTKDETSIENPVDNFNRNSMFLFYGFKDRPSINSDEIYEFPYPVPNFHNFDYNYILNQAIDPTNTKKFFNMMHLLNIQEMYFCLFQIVQACYTMDKYRLIHNDLHPNNIWATRRDDVKLNLHYKITGKDYYINNCNIMCRIYDFDRSYCERLGENPLLHNPGLVRAGQVNQVIKEKDLVKVMCYLSKYLDDRVIDSILGLFTKDVDYWLDQFNEKNIYCIITDFPEDKLYDYPQILDNIYSKITAKGKKDGVEYTDYVLL